MSGSADTGERLRKAATPWLGAALALTLAIGAGTLLTHLMMAPPGGELRDLAAYFTLSGAATLGLGWLGLRAADRTLNLSIHGKAAASAAIGGGVALLNVFIVAQLMFVSTSHDLKLLAALLVFSALVTGFFSLWVASTVVGRIQTVAGAVRSLASGDYAARAVVDAGDEVSRLAEDVNALARRLEEAEARREALERERRELTVAISHDLRTPLSSVRAMVEALDDRLVEDEAEVRQYYEAIRRESERLSGLIDDLFELAQMDAGALRLDRHEVALQEIAAEVVDAMQAQARRSELSLSLRADESTPPVSLDGSRIERAIANLVRNAMEHTPAGGRVEVSVASRNGWVELQVADTGEGIEAAELPHIWERFYRVEKSRNRGRNGDGGAGLGLAIVRGIVELHEGQTVVQSDPGNGATFVIRLPRL